MHPVLYEIPLPAWSIPLLPALLGVAAVGALIALFGWRARAFDLLAVGLCVSLISAVAALLFRGESYTLTALPYFMLREVVALWVYYLRPLVA